MAKNYYIILGIAPTATEGEIRSAFRQKAKEVHPDCSGEDCAPFRAVREAYEVLIDPRRRQAHDDELARQARLGRRQGSFPPRQAPVEPLIPHQQPSFERQPQFGPSFGAFSSLLDEMWEQLRGDPSWGSQPMSMGAEQIPVELVLTPDQAIRGGEVSLRVSGQGRCSVCGGSGREGAYLCRTCYGDGTVPKEHVVSFRFPPGVSEQSELIVPFGQPGAEDLELVVCFRIAW